MNKTSTFQFTVNNLASKLQKDIIDLNSIFNFEENYADIFEALNTLDLDVSQDVVDKILAYAAEEK